jgi:hypothetical protein
MAPGLETSLGKPTPLDKADSWSRLPDLDTKSGRTQFSLLQSTRILEGMADSICGQHL